MSKRQQRFLVAAAAVGAALYLATRRSGAVPGTQVPQTRFTPFTSGAYGAFASTGGFARGESPVPTFGTALGPYSSGAQFLQPTFKVGNESVIFSGSNPPLGKTSGFGNFTAPSLGLSGVKTETGFTIDNTPAQNRQAIIDIFGEGPNSIFT